MNRENRNEKVRVTPVYSREYMQKMLQVCLLTYDCEDKCYTEEFAIEVPAPKDFNSFSKDMNGILIGLIHKYEIIPITKSIKSVRQRINSACYYVKSHQGLSSDTVLKYSKKIAFLSSNEEEENIYLEDIRRIMCVLYNDTIEDDTFYDVIEDMINKNIASLMY